MQNAPVYQAATTSLTLEQQTLLMEVMRAACQHDDPEYHLPLWVIPSPFIIALQSSPIPLCRCFPCSPCFFRSSR
ncbi:hypothetical protein B0H14DRAFT_2761483, partial [Mycena olivaceomarginata]